MSHSSSNRTHLEELPLAVRYAPRADALPHKSVIRIDKFMLDKTRHGCRMMRIHSTIAC